MKTISALLSLLLALPAGAAPESVRTSTAAAADLPPVVITAPAIHENQVRRLKNARAAGGAAAAGGIGMAAYVVLAGSGPIGWAAALLFLGGMTAYLSHRRLEGEDDFPAASPPPERFQSAPSK